MKQIKLKLNRLLSLDMMLFIEPVIIDKFHIMKSINDVIVELTYDENIQNNMP